MKHTRESVAALANECRKNGKRIDLNGQDLRGANLRGANLRWSDLRWADLQEANMGGADLRDTDLRWADLQDANMRGANLRGANLRGADLQKADLRGADLRATDLQDANLRGANLRGADLQKADLRGADLQEADLQEADMDFTGYELSCRTIGIIADSRLISQLLYHLCRMDVHDCPEWDELRNDERVIALANQSHVIPVHVLPEIKPLKAQDEEPETKDDETTTFPAGKYYIGDPCYVFSCESWSKFCDKTDCFENGEDHPHLFSHRGHKFFGASTAHGDGTFYDSDGYRYGVDAGMLGIVPLALVELEGESIEDIEKHKLGRIHEFKEDFEVGVNELHTFLFGDIIIDTDDGGDI